jgi:hypothetical protein
MSQWGMRLTFGSTNRSEWNTRFSGDWYNDMCGQALRGKLRNTYLRGMCWQVCFTTQTRKCSTTWRAAS